MGRVVVFLLVPALIAMSGVVPALHTHAYHDHDHPEHHHALAAHHHDATPNHTNDGAARLEGCDPGAHAVAVAFVCAAPSQVHAIVAVVTVPRTPIFELRVAGTVGRSDVRVHGPPPRTNASPRAPPPIAHA